MAALGAYWLTLAIEAGDVASMIVFTLTIALGVFVAWHTRT